MSQPSEQHPPPRQEQDYPGHTAAMDPRPQDEMLEYEGGGLLAGLRALTPAATRGSAGPSRWLLPRKAPTWRSATCPGRRTRTPRHTAELAGQRCVMIRAGLAEEATCQHVVKQAVQELGGLDVLVNSVATQQPVSDFTELSTRQLKRTFRVNIFSYFWTSRAAAPA